MGIGRSAGGGAGAVMGTVTRRQLFPPSALQAGFIPLQAATIAGLGRALAVAAGGGGAVGFVPNDALICVHSVRNGKKVGGGIWA